MPGRLLVFKLGGALQAPRYPEFVRHPINTMGITSTGDATRGEAEYNRACSTCHGANAAVAYTADLRRSAALRSPELWRQIVIDGVRRDSGMISFAPILTPERAEDIRAYVLRNARRSQARGER